jgi:hypothetical protein
MRAVSGPDGPDPGDSGNRGRWIWAVSGVVTATAIAALSLALVGRAGTADAAFAVPQSAMTTTVTASAAVTSMTVDSDGAPVVIRTGNTNRVQVSETILSRAVPSGPAGSGTAGSAPTSSGSAGETPRVAVETSGGHLTVDAPVCTPAASDCVIAVEIAAPPGVTATVLSDGGTITVSGIAGADLYSDGGPVTVIGVRGTLEVNSGAGPVIADELSASRATISTNGGSADIGYSTAPGTVAITTGGGSAQLDVPGGPYALTANSGGGPETVGITTSATAARSLTISTGGGPLIISPGTGAIMPGSLPIPTTGVSLPRLRLRLGLGLGRVLGVPVRGLTSVSAP